MYLRNILYAMTTSYVKILFGYDKVIETQSIFLWYLHYRVNLPFAIIVEGIPYVL